MIERTPASPFSASFFLPDPLHLSLLCTRRSQRRRTERRRRRRLQERTFFHLSSSLFMKSLACWEKSPTWCRELSVRLSGKPSLIQREARESSRPQTRASIEAETFKTRKTRERRRRKGDESFLAFPSAPQATLLAILESTACGRRRKRGSRRWPRKRRRGLIGTPVRESCEEKRTTSFSSSSTPRLFFAFRLLQRQSTSQTPRPSS